MPCQCQCKCQCYTYLATTTISLVFFPDTLSTNYDTYQILTSTGVGDTLSVAYKNSIVSSAKLYEQALSSFILSKNYPDLQVQSSVQSVIIKQGYQPFTLPIPPTNTFSFYNSPKNTIVVRNCNNTTSQYTSTGFYPSNCLFNAYYIAFDSANLDHNILANSICASSYLTHYHP